MTTLQEKEVHSLQEFIEVESEFCNKLLEPPDDKSKSKYDDSVTSSEIWYRGQPDEQFKLIPSLYRIPYALRDELKIFNTYQRLDIDQAGDEWDLLFEMQHHEVPTRLLDWTETREIALFFALRESGSNNPALFLLNPFRLNNVRPNDEEIGFTRFKKNYPSYRKYIEKLDGTEDYRLPVAIKPDLHKGRMHQQRSTFTLHGSNMDPIEEQVSECVAKIVIAEKAVHEVRNFIMKSWDNFRIFPDKTGLALHIKKTFSLDNPLNHIVSELQKRWHHDLEYLKNPEDQNYKPLFVGLQGCVLGNGNYINVPISDKKKPVNAHMPGINLSLVSWMKGIEPSGKTQLCFILGGAGSGKTNYILNAVDTLITKDRSNKSVLWCAMGQLQEGQDIPDMLTKTLHILFEEPFGSYVNSQVVTEICQQENTILVLDGLDEFARTHGIQEAKNKITDLRKNLGETSKLKVIIGCRDHIYETSARYWVQGFGCVTEFWLQDLEQEEVAKSLAKKEIIEDDIKMASEIAARIPLFLSAARHLEIPDTELKTVTSEARFRHKILEKVIRSVCDINHDSELDEELKNLGEVAALMIDKRRDFLSESDLWENRGVAETIEHYAKKDKWPLFIQESEKEWRFVHQSIREYVLAWNVYNSFKNYQDVSGFTSTTTALDFESAEIYCFLADLVEEEKNEKIFEAVIENNMSEAGADPEKWNHRMRNLFEAVGMLGDVCSKETKTGAIKAALNILIDPSGNGKRPYANFTTVYNAVRCIERLHPSGPESHCRYRMILEKSEEDFFKFQVYAVRGFLRKQRSIGSTPSQAFRKEFDKTSDKSGLTLETYKTLKAALQKYLELEELDLHHEFIATNISFALCRWLPHNTEAIAWINNQLPVAEKLSKPIYCNLQLALWYRNETTAKVCCTYSGYILAEPQFGAHPFFQALVTDLSIETFGDSKKLTIEVPIQAQWLFSSEQREQFRNDFLKNEEEINHLQEKINSALFDHKKERIQHCLRLASGGTLPIFEIEGKEYYSLYFREIEPIGWNISNGGSENIAELYNPKLIIDRELSEELIIIDPENCLYTFKEDATTKIKRTSRQLFRALNLSDEFGKLEFKTLKDVVIIPGRDKLELTLWGKKVSEEGFYLNINATDLGIEFDQVIIVKGLKGNVRLLDGEIMNIHEFKKSKVEYVNSPVGLFDKESMDKKISENQCVFTPDVLFWGGKLVYGSFNKEKSPNTNKYFTPSEILFKFAKEKLEEKHPEEWNRFLDLRKNGKERGLCPATRMIIKRTSHICPP